MKHTAALLCVAAVVVAACSAESVARPAVGARSDAANADLGNGNGVQMALTPASSDIGVGETEQLSYNFVNPAGNLVPSNRPVEWSSSNPEIATVSDDGLVTGIADGTDTITAVGGGASGSAVVVVGCPLIKGIPTKCKHKGPKP